MTDKVVVPIAYKVAGRARATHVFLLLMLTQLFVMAAEANTQDFSALTILMQEWGIRPPSWVGSDPCAEGWEGIACSNSRVTSIMLANRGLTGQLPSAIQLLSELEILNLSLNKGLTGPLPTSLGNLTKLVYLVLAGCSFSSAIPGTIGSLEQLFYLDLNNNRLSDQIPPSIGSLSNLNYLDLTGNKLNGYIPVSSGTTPGLDMLQNAEHFHLGGNQLSGKVPPELFTSKMVLKHLILDNNNLTGRIPSTIGNVQTLLTVRLDRNSLSGHVPSSLNNLSNMTELHLSNNKLTGPIPSLTGMDLLYYVDMSNNTFDVSDVPDWFSTLQSLTTLMMENTGLQGKVPQALFSFSNLQTVVLRNNHLNGLLDIGTIYSDQLQLIDLENNLILNLTQNGGSNYTLILLGNPICDKTNMEKKYCFVSRSDSSYSMPPSNCEDVACSSGEVLSPNCKCAHPFKATLVVLFVSFSNLGNFSYYKALQASLMQSFHSYNIPVDSVSVSYPTWSSSYYLQLMLEVFPSGEDRFNETGASALASVLSNQTLPRPDYFGPYIVVFYYGKSGGSNKALVIGAAVGGSALLILVALVGVYAFQHKRKANEPWSRSIPLQTWNSNISGSVPQLKGARLFSFEELMKYTNCFSEANDIGSGGYGKVYLGILPTGQMVAIKRAKRESMQGGIEFKAEVELLSRVHHKNLVSLVGFCLEQDEQMLVYEYAPNGSLRDSLSGKSGVWLDWKRRLKVALGAARGLAYLHEHANPSIIHRDIKPNNILLDKDLNAKVADFGLSKSMVDSGTHHVTTQVKGTMGYLDPEYYMTQQLTEKSDVYSFGVVMLELITARRPIERGKYVVRVVQMAMDKTKDLYNLQKILDPAIGLGRELKGLENFVDLAMLCLEDLQAKRPRMGEVVKEIENIIQLAALNTSDISASTSGSSENVNKDLQRGVFNLQR
ncbi:PREDICTED: probable leucine-rich repeat receptor-like protein kinase At5g49770 [Prunus mume]|uniref:Probable leucine-rich repeat receptor-like protein kinase At5g49770 n=1 Tax=Prunus mume TaxID=102107 RepID=A0ABM0NMQ3_PRUMU|nr:PREDICTED: probable leucine-rich repeat receptor-like protein kinase At5g49770 [Prunus mume]